MNNVTAIIVSYNTADLLRECFTSIRKFYPIMPVIIIDGSTPGNECQHYARSIQGGTTSVKCLGYNIGHGKGMKMGIELCTTKYFLLIDSDVTIDFGGLIEKMVYCLDRSVNVYGAGQVIKVDKTGGNVNPFLEYLHPHFALIDKSMYLKYSPVLHHGAPLINAMHSLANKFVHQEDFLINFRVGHFITHHERGTRKLNPKEFHPKNWDNI